MLRLTADLNKPADSFRIEGKPLGAPVSAGLAGPGEPSGAKGERTILLAQEFITAGRSAVLSNPPIVLSHFAGISAATLTHLPRRAD